jgi:(2Fe-2S) ferredoxin
MLGTAFPAARVLLVEQPLPWGSEGLRTSRFDRATALAVEARGRAEGVRVQAIRRPGGQPSPRRRWMSADTRGGEPALRCGEFSQDTDLLELALDGSTGRPDPAPVYLVCTHGKHDPCCAQRGRPVTTALESIAPGRVWQASHLGGCRFAPTVLVLPLGLMYGRVPVAAVPELVSASEAGRVAEGGLLRGRIGLPPAAQAAIGFAHQQLGVTGARDITLSSQATTDTGDVVVRVGTPAGPREVTVQRRRVDAVGLTCAAPGPSWFVAHQPVAIEP